MSSYFSIDYTGATSAFTKFLESKEWPVELKQVSANKALLKTSSDIAEELLFFKGSEFNEMGGKIERVTL
jgi:hypothetical protein